MSQTAEAPKTVDTEDVFELLKRRGPLCASQISVELLASVKSIESILSELRDAGVVEQRPDRNESMVQEEVPWAITRNPFRQS
jgi:hypothetical protein